MGKEAVMANKKQIIDAKADKDGDIIAVKFKGNSSFTSSDTAISMAKKGQIDNAHVSHTGRGDDKEYLRTDPDGKKGNNLDTMAGDT